MFYSVLDLTSLKREGDMSKGYIDQNWWFDARNIFFHYHLQCNKLSDIPLINDTRYFFAL